MKIQPTKIRLAATVSITAIGLVAMVGGAMTGDASALSPTQPRPFWPHETGALAGTSETYVDMREDGSYYDPSLGRRLSPRPLRTDVTAAPARSRPRPRSAW